MIIEKRNFLKGMNGDFDPKLLGDGEMLNLMNGRVGITEYGKFGRVENFPGSTQISQSVYPPYGTSKTIGAVPWNDRSWIIFFNYNTFEDHGIYALDMSAPSNPVVYAILYDSQVTGGLNFSLNSRIDRNAKIVDGLLYWTDDLNEPRRINILAGIKTNHASFDTDEAAYSYPMNPEVITIIRKPPNYPLSFTKTTSGAVGITVNNNQINNFSGRFCWFYTFRDGETSTLSMHSSLANYNTAAETYDVITVRASFSEVIGQDVQKVTFAVIYAEGETAFEIRTWDKANSDDELAIYQHNNSITQLTLQFTNSEVGNAISAATLAKPYDSVPIRSKTIDRANQRIFLANNLVGYNTPTTTSLTATTVTSTTSPTALKTGSSRRIGIVFYDKYMRQCGVVPYSKLITVANKSFLLNTTYEYAVQWALSNTNALNEIPSTAYYYSIVSTKDITRTYFLQAYAGDIVYVSTDQNGVYEFDNTTYSSDNVGVGVRLNTLAGQGLGYTFNQGDLINVNVLYGSTITTATLSVKSVQGDYLVAENYDFGLINFLSVVTFEIFTPNVRTASGFYYEQGSIYAITNPTTNTRQYSTLSGLINGDVYLLNKDSLNKLSYNLIAGSTEDGNHTIGCNFVSQLYSSTDYSTGTSPLDGLSSFNPNTDNSRWILKTNASPVTFNLRGTFKIWTAHDRTYNAYIEINDGSASTIIDLVPTFTTDGGVVYTKNFNIDVTVEANCRVFILGLYTGSTTRVYYQNTTMVVTTMVDDQQTKFECMSPNDKYFNNWFTNAGRFQAIDSIGQQYLPTSIRWSNTYLSNRSNGLSSFEAPNQKLLQIELGEINKLQLANKIDEQGQGNVMLAICPTDTASLYLGEVQLMAAAQAGDIATSDQVIGTVNVLKGNFGTINPETVIEYLGLVFWLDMLNGCFVQYSNNGLEPVSRYNEARFFKNYCRDYLLTNTNNINNINGFYHIPTCVDPFHKEVICTLPALIYANYADNLPSYSSVPSYASSILDRFDIYDQLGKTMAFCYEENKWGSDFEYMGEMYAYLQNTLFAFKNGVPYTLNTNTSAWNTVFGVQYPMRICGTANLNPSLLKDLANIAIESSVEPDFSVAMANFPNEQITDLAATDYTDQQGNFYAAWLGDRLDPNQSGTADQKLYTGSQLTDKAIFWMVEWNTIYNQLIWCNFVNIGWQESRGQKAIANPVNK